MPHFLVGTKLPPWLAASLWGHGSHILTSGSRDLAACFLYQNAQEKVCDGINSVSIKKDSTKERCKRWIHVTDNY